MNGEEDSRDEENVCPLSVGSQDLQMSRMISLTAIGIDFDFETDLRVKPSSGEQGAFDCPALWLPSVRPCRERGDMIEFVKSFTSRAVMLACGFRGFQALVNRERWAVISKGGEACHDAELVAKAIVTSRRSTF
jgi:hypothetical protein